MLSMSPWDCKGVKDLTDGLDSGAETPVPQKTGAG